MDKDQHFMIDKETIRKIVSLAEIGPEETVIEIGAGHGAMTKELVKHAKKVIAIELDKKLKPILERNVGGFKNVNLLIKNALKTDLSADKIIGNLPYAICEALIQKLSEHDFKKAVFTVSKSFAYRLLAKSGDQNHSKLSDFSQKNFKIRIEMSVPKEVFKPKPKTNSVVISLVKTDRKRLK
ncbi:MAG: rRNA adenine N-6-methyltransferase family protein [Nanoarchaeota archaeon]